MYFIDWIEVSWLCVQAACCFQEEDRHKHAGCFQYRLVAWRESWWQEWQEERREPWRGRTKWRELPKTEKKQYDKQRKRQEENDKKIKKQTKQERDNQWKNELERDGKNETTKEKKDGEKEEKQEAERRKQEKGKTKRETREIVFILDGTYPREIVPNFACQAFDRKYEIQARLNEGKSSLTPSPSQYKTENTRKETERQRRE